MNSITTSNPTATIKHYVCVRRDKSVFLEASANGNIPSGQLGERRGEDFVPITHSDIDYRGLSSPGIAQSTLMVWTDKKVDKGDNRREFNGLVEDDELAYLSAAVGSTKEVAPGLLGLTTGIEVSGLTVNEELTYIIAR
jgi:hypothetical protein